LIILLMLIISF